MSSSPNTRELAILKGSNSKKNSAFFRGILIALWCRHLDLKWSNVSCVEVGGQLAYMASLLIDYINVIHH